MLLLLKSNTLDALERSEDCIFLSCACDMFIPFPCMHFCHLGIAAAMERAEKRPLQAAADAPIPLLATPFTSSNLAASPPAASSATHSQAHYLCNSVVSIQDACEVDACALLPAVWDWRSPKPQHTTLCCSSQLRRRPHPVVYCKTYNLVGLFFSWMLLYHSGRCVRTSTKYVSLTTGALGWRSWITYLARCPEHLWQPEILDYRPS